MFAQLSSIPSKNICREQFFNGCTFGGGGEFFPEISTEKQWL
jgi:hypothetical protein